MAALPLYFDLQFFTNSGAVAADHLLYTYDNGTTTPKATYTDAGAGTPNANPIQLNSAGRCALWLLPTPYSFEVRTSAGVLVKRFDDVDSAVGLASLAGLTATSGAALVGYSMGTDYDGVAGAPANVAQAIQEMLGATTFTLYVATTGSDSNDGSVSAPFATLQKAFNVLMALGTMAGTRIINIAAGTYSSSSARAARIGPANASESVPNTNYQANGVNSANRIIIQGAEVGYNPSSAPEAVPTTIFDGGGAAAVGIQGEGGVRLVVRNIKFQNYNGSSSSAGISGDGCWIRTENVHGSNNNMDISNVRGHLEVRGGRLDGATLYSIRSLFVNVHSIGNQGAGAAGQGPFISNAVTGLHVQEGSTGHSDYVTYEDCTDAIRVTVNSRVNFSGSEFARCSRGVRADGNSVIFYSSANFNDGTADECDENIVIQQGATDITRDAYSNSGVATAFAGPVSHTGTLTSTALLTQTLKQSRFAPVQSGVRQPQVIKLTAFGSISGSAGAKQFKLRLGSTVLASITNTASDTDWRCDGLLVFTSPTDQKAQITYLSHNSTVKINTDTGTEDMRAGDSDLTFEVQLTDIADTVTVTQAFFEVWG